MLIKFFKNGQGGGTGPVGYLIAREVLAYDQNRHVMRDSDGNVMMITRDPLPEVLRGNAERMENMIDAVEHQWRYRTGVISFTREDAPDTLQQQKVMDAFEQLAFAGLEPDQYEIMWVRHSHEQRVELHFLTPRMELESGRSLNIAPPGYQKNYDALRDCLNKEHGWADPEAPEHSRDTRSIIEDVRRGEAREKIHDWLLDRIAEGGIQDRETMLNALRHEGFDIPRASKNYITVRDPETDERFRLKGYIFHENWTRQSTLERTIEREAGTGNRSGSRLDQIDFGVLHQRLYGYIEQRTRYNQERYGRAIERVPQREQENHQHDHVRSTAHQEDDAVWTLGDDHFHDDGNREHIRFELLMGAFDDPRSDKRKLSADWFDVTLYGRWNGDQLGSGENEIRRVQIWGEFHSLSDAEFKLASINNDQPHEYDREGYLHDWQQQASEPYSEQTPTDGSGKRIDRLRRKVDQSLRNISSAVREITATIERNDRNTAEFVGKWRSIFDLIPNIVDRGVQHLRDRITRVRERFNDAARQRNEFAERFRNYENHPLDCSHSSGNRSVDMEHPHSNSHSERDNEHRISGLRSELSR